jgi:hypothetical protein
MQIQGMRKQNATAAAEEKKKKGRPCKRWREKVQEELNIMGI